MRPVESSQGAQGCGDAQYTREAALAKRRRTVDSEPCSGSTRLPRNVPDAVEIVAERLARAAERELVPRDRIGLEEPRLQAFFVPAQLAADAVAA